MEKIQQVKDVWKGYDFWVGEIKKTGVFDQIRSFNDIITGTRAPLGYGDAPVVRDVVLDGQVCDIWHTDHKRTDSGCRIFIHKKGAVEASK